MTEFVINRYYRYSGAGKSEPATAVTTDAAQADAIYRNATQSGEFERVELNEHDEITQRLISQKIWDETGEVFYR